MKLLAEAGPDPDILITAAAAGKTTLHFPKRRSYTLRSSVHVGVAVKPSMEWLFMRLVEVGVRTSYPVGVRVLTWLQRFAWLDTNDCVRVMEADVKNR